MSGIEFQSLHLESMPFFKRQSFNLAQKGVSLILGRNLDSSNQNTNGCGKSLFFSQLPELLIGEPTIGFKQDLIRKGHTSLTFKTGDNTYKVTRQFKPGEKIHIEKNGVDLEYRELSVAKAELRKLLPFNPEEVLSLLYLDSRIPHPLVRGSSSIRQKFFMDFFRMNSAPAMRKLIKADIDALSSKSGAYKVHQERLKELKSKLDAHDLDQLLSRQEKVKSSLVKYEVKAKHYASLERIRDDYESIKVEAAALKDLGVSSWREAQDEAVSIEEKLSSVAEQLSQWKRYDSWVENQQELLTRKKEVKAALRAFPQQEALTVKQLTISIDELVEDIDSYNAKLDKLKVRLREVSESVEDSARSELKAAKRKYKDLEEATGSCPTCGAAYDNKHAKKELRIVDGTITSIQVGLEEIGCRRDALIEKKDSIEASLKIKCETLEAWRKVRKLKNEQDSWEESETVKEPKTDKDILVERRAKLKAKYQTLLSSKPVFIALRDYKDLSKDDLLLLRGESPTSKLLALHEESGELKMQVEEVKELTAEYKKLKADLKSIESELDEKAALDVLFEAFSKKGVESLMIKLVCDRLEQQVNKYARLLFPEDFKFKFDLETQFNITVTRKYGKGEITSDVRKLSGAESLLFSLILLISLLAFVPPKNRTNLLILDEPQSTFGPEMKQSFNKFLPILNSVIPHIIVITPDPGPGEEYPKGTRVYTVQKKGGKSTIVESKSL